MATRTLTVNLVGRSKNLERAFDRSSKSAGSMAAGIGKAVGSAGKAMLGLGAVFVGGAFAAKQFVDVAVDVAESLSKNKVVFGESADAIEAFADTAADSLGMSRRQALEATGTFGTLAAAMKIPEQQAAEMSTTMTALAADMASFNNASPEETLLALQSGLRGEAEPLRRFGVLLDAATLKQEALRQGLIDNEKTALTPVQKALAAYGIILEQTKIQQGDFERTSDGLANTQRTLAAKFENVKEKLGEQLMPLFESAVGWLVDSGIPKLEEFGDRFANIISGDAVDGIDGFVVDIISAVGGIVDNITGQLPMHESLAGRLGAIYGSIVDPVADGIVAGIDRIGEEIADSGGFLRWADELDENIAGWIDRNARDFWHGWMVAIGQEQPTQEEVDRIARNLHAAATSARDKAFGSAWGDLTDIEVANWLGFDGSLTAAQQAMVDEVQGDVSSGDRPSIPGDNLRQNVTDALFGAGPGRDIMGPFNPSQNAQIDAAIEFISALPSGTPSSAFATGNSIVVNMPPGSDGDDVVAALSRWSQVNGPLPAQLVG